MDLGELENLQKKWEKMHQILRLEDTDESIYELIFSRLVWLKKRMDNCKENKEFSLLRHYFNETIIFFNEQLNLEEDKKFTQI